MAATTRDFVETVEEVLGEALALEDANIRMAARRSSAKGCQLEELTAEWFLYELEAPERYCENKY